MRAAEGILTCRGGMTSHAALVARGWGKCCIVGAGMLHIDSIAKKMTVDGKTFKEGDRLTLNGTKGYVYEGNLNMIDATENPRFQAFMKLVDKQRKMGVRTNADTPKDSEVALKFGAEGIGLAAGDEVGIEGQIVTGVLALHHVVHGELGSDGLLRKQILEHLPVTLILIDQFRTQDVGFQNADA
jgi:phosphoenolpyruvate synthase/pyruvate phosphate dikinase